MLENYTLYFYIGSGAIALLLAIWILSIELRLKKLFRGKKTKDLENLLFDINSELKKLNISKENIEKYLKTVEKRLKKSIQKTGVIRFNPFENSGSNQSFAIALLNEDGNGIIISSLYSRDKVSIYSKPIKNYKSEYPLSKEEQEVIIKSKENE